MDFSVIIPVFNSQEYIERCLVSVLAQTSCTFEIIVVNDGSVDDSESIIAGMAANNENFTVIMQKNSGVSVARNSGLNVAVGKYVIFIDSDDWIEKGYFEFIIEKLEINQLDGLLLNYFIDTGSEVTKSRSCVKSAPMVLTGNDFGLLFLESAIMNSPCDKVFRRDLYVKYNIRFPIGLSVGEDAVAVSLIGLHVNRIGVYNECFLHYMQDSNGVTKSKTTNLMLVSIVSAMKLTTSIYNKKYSNSLIYKMVFRQIIFYFLSVGFDKETPSKESFDYFVHVIGQLRVKNFTSFKWKLVFILLIQSKRRNYLYFINLLYSIYIKFKSRV